MSFTQIDEPIKVYAFYETTPPRPSRLKALPHKKIMPLSFIWREREYKVEDLTYVWHNKKGETDYYHFAVSDGTNIYELVYNTKTFDWILHRIYCEG